MDIGKKVREVTEADRPVSKPIAVPNWPKKAPTPIEAPDWPKKRPEKVPAKK